MNQTLSSEDSGKVSTRTMGFEHTLAPSKGYSLRTQVPLWFYKCNQCHRIMPVERLRLKHSGKGSQGDILEMLLCDNCLLDYNEWNYRWVGYGNVQRA